MHENPYIPAFVPSLFDPDKMPYIPPQQELQLFKQLRAVICKVPRHAPTWMAFSVEKLETKEIHEANRDKLRRRRDIKAKEMKQMKGYWR